MFIKTELEQGNDKPSFDVILGILVDVSVFKRNKAGFFCRNAVKPRPRLPALRWSL